MVLLEAVSLNTPIVAFNCKSGPSEIIKNIVSLENAIISGIDDLKGMLIHD